MDYPSVEKTLTRKRHFQVKRDSFGKCWWLAYIQEICNSTNSEVKFAKKVYFDNAFKENGGDLRKTRRIINELTSRKSKSSFVKEIKVSNGNFIHDPLELSDSFNDHFCNISPRLANEIHFDEKVFRMWIICVRLMNADSNGKHPLYPLSSPPKNHYKTTLEERKTGIRAVWPKLSVLNCRYKMRTTDYVGKNSANWF